MTLRPTAGWGIAFNEGTSFVVRLRPLVTKTGFVDFDSRNPLLEEAEGTVWRLVGAFEGLLMGSDAHVTGVELGNGYLEVRAFEMFDDDDGSAWE